MSAGLLLRTPAVAVAVAVAVVVVVAVVVTIPVDGPPGQTDANPTPA